MIASARKRLVFGVTLSAILLAACTTDDAEQRVINLLELTEEDTALREEIAMHLRERQFTLLLILASPDGNVDGILTEGFYCALLGPRDSTGRLREGRYTSADLIGGACPHSTDVRLSDIRVVAIDSAMAATEVNLSAEAVQIRTNWQHTETGWKASRMISINNNDLRASDRAPLAR